MDIREDFHILTINDAVIEDEGSYTLKVVNETGSVSVTVMVTAKGEPKVEPKEEPKVVEDEKPKEREPCKPKIEMAPEPVEFEEGETVTLSCKVSGQTGTKAKTLI